VAFSWPCSAVAMPPLLLAPHELLIEFPMRGGCGLI